MIKKLYTKYKVENGHGEKIYAEIGGGISILPWNGDNCFHFIDSDPKLVKRIVKLFEEALELYEKQ